MYLLKMYLLKIYLLKMYLLEKKEKRATKISLSVPYMDTSIAHEKQEDYSPPPPFAPVFPFANNWAE